MLLQLMRDGKAHLSDPAEKYVTELKSVRSRYPDAAPVTLMQLRCTPPDWIWDRWPRITTVLWRGGSRA